MNTHDIELPPIPKPKNGGLFYEQVDLKDYARAAIEADRKLQYRPVYEEGWKDALEWADRKRRGEPVGEAVIDICEHGHKFAKLTDHPVNNQGHPSCVHCLRIGLAKARAAQPADPRLDAPAQVGPVRFGIGVKWSTVILAAQRHHEYMRQPEQEQARMKKFGEAIKSIQPAEPVKCIGCEGKPAPENNPCSVCGESAEPVKVPSDDEIIELRSEFDWREHYGNIRFARALLARYTTTKEQP